MSMYPAIKARFDDLAPLPELSGEQRDIVLSLIGNPAFELLLRYLLSERQGYMMMLSRVDLAAMSAAASVLQGKIQGLERVTETVLELVAQTQAVPVEE